MHQKAPGYVPEFHNTEFSLQKELPVPACLIVPNPFEGLIWSQALLSLQLPITVFVLIRLTSSSRVMGKYANSHPLNALLVGIGAVVTILDVVLLTGM